MKRQNLPTSRRRIGSTASSRRGFNLVEMLIALAITGALLSAVLFALNASFQAYQATTEVASTNTIGRLTMHRMLALIRTGKDFGPYPTNPLEDTLTSDFIEFRTPDDQVMSLQWIGDGQGVHQNESLYVVMNPNTAQETWYLLLEGVKAQYDPDTGDQIKPFTMQYIKGRHLYRATIDLTIKPDDNMSVMLDGKNDDIIRLVASAMPRTATY